MSTTSTDGGQQLSQEQILDSLRFLTADYCPKATWTVGGAFRYDEHLLPLITFFATNIGVRSIDNVAGAPPCPWTLDYFVQRRPFPIGKFCDLLETYARNNVGVRLVFDNPFVDAADLDDPFCAMMIKEFYARDRVRKNRIVAASDAVADKIHALCPRIPVDCHYNRLIAETAPRDAALYNNLLARYKRVCLHPADAANTELLAGITEPQRLDVVLNDPSLRANTRRREHLQLLADMRRRPYDTTLMARRAELVNAMEGNRFSPAALAQKAACTLTRTEAQQLHDADVRSFIIQAQHFRNENTLLWDIFQCMFSYSPENINKHALIASSAMAEYGKPKGNLPSGLKQFAFSQYE